MSSLTYHGFHNEVPQIGRLTQQIFLRFWKPPPLACRRPSLPRVNIRHFLCVCPTLFSSGHLSHPPGPAPMTLFSPGYLFKDLLSTHSPALGHCMVRISAYEIGGDKTQSFPVPNTFNNEPAEDATLIREPLGRIQVGGHNSDTCTH